MITFPEFGQLAFLQADSYVFVTYPHFFFSSSLFSGSKIGFRNSQPLSCPSLGISHFSEAMVPFSGEWYLETKIWANHRSLSRSLWGKFISTSCPVLGLLNWEMSCLEIRDVFPLFNLFFVFQCFFLLNSSLHIGFEQFVLTLLLSILCFIYFCCYK